MECLGYALFPAVHATGVRYLDHLEDRLDEAETSGAPGRPVPCRSGGAGMTGMTIPATTAQWFQRFV